MVETFGTEKIGRAKIAAARRRALRPAPGRVPQGARPAPADLPEDRRLRPLRPRGRGLHLGAHRQGRGARRGRRPRRSRVGVASQRRLGRGAAQPSPAPATRSARAASPACPRRPTGRGRRPAPARPSAPARHGRDRRLLRRLPVGGRGDHAHDLALARARLGARLALLAFARARPSPSPRGLRTGSTAAGLRARRAAERGRLGLEPVAAARGRRGAVDGTSLCCTAAVVGGLTSPVPTTSPNGRPPEKIHSDQHDDRAERRPGHQVDEHRRAFRCFPACRTESASGQRRAGSRFIRRFRWVSALQTSAEEAGDGGAAARRELRGLRDPGDLLRRRARDRVRREALHQDEPRLLPLGPLAARVDHGPGVHLGQPRRARDPRHGGQRRAVRRLHGPLLLGRRDPGDGLPRDRDDALLLRLEGPQRARVPAAALQQADARLQLAELRARDRADRRREPVRARARAEAAARLADPASASSSPPRSCSSTSRSAASPRRSTTRSCSSSSSSPR